MTSPTTFARKEITTADVHQFLKQFVAAYEDSTDAFVRCFSKDATFILASHEARIDGAEEYRRLFERKAAGARRMRILSPEVRAFGDHALASYASELEADGQRIKTRVSLLLVWDDKTTELKASHIHSSHVGAIPAPPPGKSIHDIAVLEERVATAIAAVGTPK